MTALKPLAKTQPTLPGLELAEPTVAADPELELARTYRRRIDADIATIGAAATLLRLERIREDEAISRAEAEADPRRPGMFAPGDVVVFRARFVMAACAGLRAVKLASEWTVQECACELCEYGEHVCTTEWNAGYDSFRHLARAHIRHRGSLEVDECPLGLSKLINIPSMAPVAPTICSCGCGRRLASATVVQ